MVNESNEVEAEQTPADNINDSTSNSPSSSLPPSPQRSPASPAPANDNAVAMETSSEGAVVTASPAAVTTSSDVVNADIDADVTPSEPRKRKHIVDEEDSAEVRPAAARYVGDIGEAVAAADNDMAFLKQYYHRLFPAHLFMQWLHPTNVAQNKLREFSFTLVNDVYIRFLSFSTHDEFRNALIARAPIKIDIGAVYNVSPAMKTSIGANEFKPMEKELVFDVDMTEYDDVRTCCSEANICTRCWPLMTAAVVVVDAALRKDFGFKHIMWVYSGRRGVHCWISDKRAKSLSNDGRTAIVEYLSIAATKDMKGGKKNSIYFQFPLHPALQRAYDMLLPMFIEQLDEQGYLSTPEQIDKIYSFFDQSVRHEFVFKEKELLLEGREKWKVLERRVRVWNGTNRGPRNAGVNSVLERIVFTHTYPRLDVNVSKQLNHLLKAPFCVHPKTGRVCVPIDVNNVTSFDPFSVPTLTQLERELNRAGLSEDWRSSWRKTSLKGPLEAFRDHVRALRADNAKIEAASEEANVNDW